MSSPPAKRQKLDTAVDVFSSSNPNDSSSILTIRDLSFQTPLRKKLNLIFTSIEIQAHSAAKQELSIPLSQIRHVISVAAPDKTAKTWYFVVIYGEKNEGFDACVFGVPETVAKTAVGSDKFKFDNEQSHKSVLFDAFKQLSGIVVAEPSAAEFTSPIPQPGRPKETAYHAVSHRGAKEGYLYFLSTGILYGFKKPVQFFPIDTIREVTFTNILQRTFNLVVSTEDNVEGEEFEMIDQALFPGVQGYTVKHKIQDASLSEERKARRVGKENKEEEESGELEKAVKEYEAEYSDEDDHDFRDFDKAEADWEDGEVSKGKGKGKVKNEARPGKRQPVAPQQPVANGNEIDTSDDEELDATFEGGDSGDGSPGDTSDEDDSDDDSGSDDSEDDDDEDEEAEDEDEEAEEEDDEDED